jgi:large subunit ribosomal protein L4
MKLDVYNLQNAKVGEVDVSDDVFGVEVKPHLHHEVVKYQLAKRRAGTHKVKGRSEVNRTSKKLYKQKGTGNARHGSRRAPIFVGGGVVFGPTPRSHAIKVPRKVRRGALRSVLSQKVGEGKLKVLDSWAMDGPKTKVALAHLMALGATSALVVDVENDALKLSVRNLPSSKFLKTGGLNVRDLVHYDHLIITQSALQEIEGALKP